VKGLIRRAAAWVGKHPALVGALVAGGLAVALYARTISFGSSVTTRRATFRWIENVPWTGWFTSSLSHFVRPLYFGVYKLLWLILGGYSAPGYHLVLLILHVLNALLVGVLASSLSRQHFYGWLAAVLFAAFPLSHEAVSEVDSLCHPLVAFWALLALVLFERGRRTGNRYYLWAVHPAVLLALLTHENGLVVPALILTLDLIYYPPRFRAGTAAQPGSSVLRTASAVPALVDTGPERCHPGATHPRRPHAKYAPLYAGRRLLIVAYRPAGRHAMDVAPGTDWRNSSSHICGGTPSAPGASMAFRNRMDRDCGCADSPPFSSGTTSSEALAFTTSLGRGCIALGFASSSDHRCRQGLGCRRAVLTGVGALLALIIILPPIPYITCHLDLFDQATALVRLVSAKAGTAPAGRNLVYVNLPAFFISNAEHPRGCPSTYPFVSTGVGVFPSYGDLRDFVRVNGGPDRPALGVIVTDYDPNWPPRYGDALPASAMRDTLQHNQVYVFEIGSWSLPGPVGGWQPNASPTPLPLATFGDVLVLEEAAVQPGAGDLVVTLQWQVQQVPAQPVTAFVHVYDRDGKLLAQHDGPLGQEGSPVNYIPISLWQAGDRIRDVHAIPLQSSSLPEDYAVAVGLYDPATVTRLPARSAQGTALSNDLYVVGQ